MATAVYPGVTQSLGWERGHQRKDYYHSFDHDEQLMPIREIFMMHLMDKLTDKTDWHNKIFNDAIVHKWRQEALAQSERELYDYIIFSFKNATDTDLDAVRGWYPEGATETERYYQDDEGVLYPKHLPFPRCRIVSDKAFDFCIQELRAKASHFSRTHLVPTLDAFSRAVAKSDSLVNETLRSQLCNAFAELRADQAQRGLDWHPRTGEKVLDLVHPSMYPFVYGRSPFIEEEVIGVRESVSNWSGKGKPTPSDPMLGKTDDQLSYPFKRGGGMGWSRRYQWLPTNVALADDSVHFSSYVNNLHPQKYPHIYKAIEELINLAIPAWDQVLGEGGRTGSRFSLPTDANDDETEGLWEKLNVELLEKEAPELNGVGLESLVECSNGESVEDISEVTAEQINKWKWEVMKDAIFPEPDQPATVDYACKESIRDIFRDSGLQVYVKMASIELTPDKPEFAGGGWHVEGMYNDRICATALYYLDSENITPSSLEFRMTTERDQEELSYASGQDAYNWLERVYGTDFRNSLNLQYYGRVDTRQGRLLAFPNVFQHRVSPFSLKDRSKPGHRSFVALWLVDPTTRLVSTANVPPQQLDWWAEAVFGHQNPSQGSMPPEVLQLLKNKSPDLAKRLNDGLSKPAGKGRKLPVEVELMVQQADAESTGLMSLEEARRHRESLMDERSVNDRATDHATHVGEYNFCEH